MQKSVTCEACQAFIDAIAHWEPLAREACRPVVRGRGRPAQARNWRPVQQCEGFVALWLEHLRAIVLRRTRWGPHLVDNGLSAWINLLIPAEALLTAPDWNRVDRKPLELELKQREQVEQRRADERKTRRDQELAATPAPLPGKDFTPMQQLKLEIAAQKFLLEHDPQAAREHREVEAAAKQRATTSRALVIGVSLPHGLEGDRQWQLARRLVSKWLGLKSPTLRRRGREYWGLQ